MERPEGPKPFKTGRGLINKVLATYAERISDWKIKTIQCGAGNQSNLHSTCQALNYFRKI